MAAGKKSLPPAAVPSPAVREEREPLVRKWWVWAGAGAAALVTGGIIYAVMAPDPRTPTLGTISRALRVPERTAQPIHAIAEENVPRLSADDAWSRPRLLHPWGRPAMHAFSYSVAARVEF